MRQQTAAGSQQLQLEHGVIIVATGGKEFQPQQRYLYGEDNRVLTQLELEDRIKAENLTLGPTSKIVMIQCVGSQRTGTSLLQPFMLFRSHKKCYIIKGSMASDGSDHTVSRYSVLRLPGGLLSPG